MSEPCLKCSHVNCLIYLKVSVKTIKELTAAKYVSEMSALELNRKHVQYSTRVCSFLEFKPEQTCRPCWGYTSAYMSHTFYAEEKFSNPINLLVIFC